jgi:hypothetical protein
MVLLSLGTGIFLVWSTVTIGGFFLNRPVDTAIHGIMLATITGLLGGAAIAGRKANGKNGS